MQTTTAPVPPTVTFGPSEKQSRVTIFFRFILAIPHLIVLYAFSIAAGVMIFIAWFAALFTARVPEGMADFIGGVMRYMTRFYAYVFLVEGKYPPFGIQAGGYPVDVAYARPDRFNRLAVFFRIFLVIPATIVGTVALAGWFVLSLFFWLAALVKGRLPDSVRGATTAILRYLGRTWLFYGLVTNAYPTKLYGDAAAADTPDAQPGFVLTCREDMDDGVHHPWGAQLRRVHRDPDRAPRERSEFGRSVVRPQRRA
jgi:hypothetical protein